MNFLKITSKEMMQAFITIFFAKSDKVPIVLGPLRNRSLPKQLASQNIAMILGQYEPHVIRELFNMPRPIKVAYDIGAHVGFMTLGLANRVGRGGRVFAFEPIPENQIYINRLVDINQLHGIIKVIPLALGESNGKKRMLLREHSSMHQLEEVHQGRERNLYSTVDVESRTLDSFVFERGNPSPQLIKIDVEGAEELVLKGALKTMEVYKPTFLVEIHGPQNALKIWNLVEGTGYRCYHLARGSRQQTVSGEEVRSYFSPSSWTHHFLLTHGPRVSSANDGRCPSSAGE